jgi:hypothetical protein
MVNFGTQRSQRVSRREERRGRPRKPLGWPVCRTRCRSPRPAESPVTCTVSGSLVDLKVGVPRARPCCRPASHPPRACTKRFKTVAGQMRFRRLASWPQHPKAAGIFHRRGHNDCRQRLPCGGYAGTGTTSHTDAPALGAKDGVVEQKTVPPPCVLPSRPKAAGIFHWRDYREFPPGLALRRVDRHSHVASHRCACHDAAYVGMPP